MNTKGTCVFNICKKLLTVCVFIAIISGCKKDEESDIYGINHDTLESIKAIVVDTQAGWTLLSERYGFLELLYPLHDSLRTDGMKVLAQINRGNTYFDDTKHSLDNHSYDRDFTFAIIKEITIDSTLFSGPEPPVIEIFWSQDYNDEVKKFSEGYGYYVQATEDGIKIRQPSFPGIGGLGAFKTKTEAYKNGMLVMHRLKTVGGLPSTKKPDLDFLKIDWYVWIPD